MAAKEPTSDLFAGTGLGIRYIGNHIYGYSGKVGCGNTETDLLNAGTGNYYSKVTVLFAYGTDTIIGDDYILRIRLNGAIIWQTTLNHVEAQYGHLNKIDVVIPPYTELRCTAVNATDVSVNDMIAVIAGRAYATD